MSPVEDAESHRRALWGIAYRMTGTVQDADDVVQDCFVRLLENPPADTTRPLRPWLVTVTLNLARDRLRRRRRQAYVGPWLPAPVADARLADASIQLRESARWAFLCASEALTPTQRAVFIAREVLDLSAAETAEALGNTPSAVDVALHRARKALGSMPAAPTLMDDAVVAGFFALLQVGLPGAARRLLHPEAEALNDGAGRVNAARQPIRGAAKLLTFFRRLAGSHGAGSWSIVRANGLLTLVGSFPPHPHPRLRMPTVFTMAAEVREGRIVRFYSQLNDEKLSGVLPRPNQP
jgi:RNA polymerase sigma factor (sigma-70 family)